MNKFKFYFILLITTAVLFSCSKKEDDIQIEPIRDFQTQYNRDIIDIETYLTSNYITITEAPGQPNDQDVIIAKITDVSKQKNIMSYLGATTFPKLIKKEVTFNNISLKLYYLVLREGTGKSPCNVDGVFAAYKGTYLSNTEATADVASTQTVSLFEEVKIPKDFLSLFATVRGWSEVFPQFKTGNYEADSDGSIKYTNFGAGVMFLPSGLGYFSQGVSSIPAYSPLVFSFKLYEIQRLDQDKDGIPSYLEDQDGDGYMYVLPAGQKNIDDTDGDGIPDFLDTDDDGDNYTTRFETQYINPLDPNKTILYYPYDGALVDDPTTLYVDERQGIPAYSASGNPDYTTPGAKGRLRIHLDKDHHTAKP